MRRARSPAKPIDVIDQLSIARVTSRLGRTMLRQRALAHKGRDRMPIDHFGGQSSPIVAMQTAPKVRKVADQCFHRGEGLAFAQGAFMFVKARTNGFVK